MGKRLRELDEEFICGQYERDDVLRNARSLAAEYVDMHRRNPDSTEIKHALDTLNASVALLERAI